MYFPIPPNAMSADKEFIQLREGETVTIGRTVVSNLSLYHPGTAYAYRFDDGESVFVFASDAEYKALTDTHLRGISRSSPARTSWCLTRSIRCGMCF